MTLLRFLDAVEKLVQRNHNQLHDDTSSYIMCNYSDCQDIADYISHVKGIAQQKCPEFNVVQQQEGAFTEPIRRSSPIMPYHFPKSTPWLPMALLLLMENDYAKIGH